MIGGAAISQRYARALFALGEETVGPETLLSEIEELTETATVMPELGRVLFTPLHPRAERRAVVSELARRLELSEPTRAFSMLLVDENRMALLAEIRDRLRELVEQAAGRVKAKVTSARPLEPRQLEELRGVLSRRVNALVSVESRVDPDLLGGLVVRVGDLRFDGSLRTQLDFLHGSLRKGSR